MGHPRDRFGRLKSTALRQIVGRGLESQVSELPLPCLNRNNSDGGQVNESDPAPPVSQILLSTSHRKSAAALIMNVANFCTKFGIEKVGFLTLTFGDHVTDYREAQRRFNSLRKMVLKHRYLDWIRVIERQKSGRIHYHLLVALSEDIRTGFDFSAIEKHDYRSANKALRDQWAFWREVAPKYNFGRTELLPVKSNSEGISKYVGKYIGKSIENRLPEDKGCRLVEYSSGARMASSKFQFVSKGSSEWRRKVSIFVHYIAENTGCTPTFEGMRQMLGSGWAYQWREFILSLP